MCEMRPEQIQGPVSDNLGWFSFQLVGGETTICLIFNLSLPRSWLDFQASASLDLS